MRDGECYFCDEFRVLEDHHIVPQRHGGHDKAENLVTVCPTCHQKLEKLYDTRFYKQLGVGSGYSKDVEEEQKSLSEANQTADYYIPDQVRWYFRVFNEIVAEKGRDVSDICTVVRSGSVYFRFHLKSAWRKIAPFKGDAESGGGLEQPDTINSLRSHFRALQKESKLVHETSITARVDDGTGVRCVSLDYELTIEKTPLQINEWPIDHSRAMDHADVQVDITEAVAND